VWGVVYSMTPKVSLSARVSALRGSSEFAPATNVLGTISQSQTEYAAGTNLLCTIGDVGHQIPSGGPMTPSCLASNRTLIESARLEPEGCE
jgi:hypothetical protein